MNHGITVAELRCQCTKLWRAPEAAGDALALLVMVQAMPASRADLRMRVIA